MRYRAAYVFVVLGIAVLNAHAGDSVLTWGLPINVSGGLDVGTGEPDSTPMIATDFAGTWMIVWSSEENLTGIGGPNIGADTDILSTISMNNGETWSNPVAVNSNAGTDTVQFGTSIGVDLQPFVAAARDNTWVCVWTSATDAIDSDMLFSRTTNNGATWSDREALGGADGNTGDLEPRLATDRLGNWIAMSDKVSVVQSVNSIDNALSWSGRQSIHNVINPSDEAAWVATDEAGTWMASVAFNSGSFGQKAGAVTSFDNGATWQPIVTVFETVDYLDTRTALATDRRGTWIMAMTRTPLNPVGPARVWTAVSRDSGVTWSEPIPVQTDEGLIPNESQTDLFPRIATDQRGNWIVVWYRNASGAGLRRIYSALSTNDGASWLDPVQLNVGEASSVTTPIANIAADTQGNWVATWESDDPPGGAGFGTDIVVSKAIFTGNVAGVVTLGGTPVSCAALRVTDTSGEVDRVAVTDENGAYAFDGLPLGDYMIDIFASGVPFGMQPFSITIDETTTNDINLAATSDVPRITGIVLGETAGIGGDEEPIFGARVDAKIADVIVETTYTCGRGFYGLLLPGVAKGDDTAVTVTISADGYVGQDVPVSLPSGENQQANATLLKAIDFLATMSGQVTDGEGAPITGARVEAAGAVTLASTTDGDGIYAFDAIPTGVFDVRASASGYDAGSAIQSVTSANPVTLNFELDSQTPAEPNDVNGDDSVNAQDIQIVINSVLGIPTPFDTDINDDNATNSVDIQLVINAVLGV